jgi:hypothetical protein
MITQEHTAEKFRMFSEVLIDLEEILLRHEATINTKPNYHPTAFRAACRIFLSAILDAMFDVQVYDNMDIEDRKLMAENCGNEIKKLIYKYTNIDTTKLYDKAH